MVKWAYLWEWSQEFLLQQRKMHLLVLQIPYRGPAVMSGLHQDPIVTMAAGQLRSRPCFDSTDWFGSHVFRAYDFRFQFDFSCYYRSYLNH